MHHIPEVISWQTAVPKKKCCRLKQAVYKYCSRSDQGMGEEGKEKKKEKKKSVGQQLEIFCGLLRMVQ